MRDYKLKSSGLPSYVYAQVIAIVRGYEDMRLEYDRMLEKSARPPDGQPKGTGVSGGISGQAIRRADISQKLEAIEQSLVKIPEEYRQGVWDNALYATPYPRGADRTTYWRYKAKFFRDIARKMNWI